MMRAPTVLAGALVLIASCLSPEPPDGSILCNPSGKACPDNYTCAADSRCYRNGGSGGNPDAMDNCANYCNCISVSCPTGFADEGACLRACNDLSPTALHCRVYHCGLAKDDPVMHCPHALGMAICQ